MLYLKEGKEIFDKHGSCAEDAKTKTREVKFIASHMLNKLDILMEVSDYLCASILLEEQQILYLTNSFLTMEMIM